jgi:3-oxoacyl-[acyl-carrier-protein] synthase-3
MAYFSKIIGTGSYLPEARLTNSDLEKRVDTSHDWIVSRTGIHNRYIAAPEQASSDLAYEAAIKALESASLKPSDLNAILIATTTPDFITPSTACILQSRLGCGALMALDVSAACSGFLYALAVADQFIRSGMYKNILVVGAEALTRIVDDRDRNTCILFGDGAGAFVLTQTTSAEHALCSSHLSADGDNAHTLQVPGGGSRTPFSQAVLDQRMNFLKMDGKEVFKSAVRTLTDRCKDALAANHLAAEDITWFVVHQANLRIIDAVADLLRSPKEKYLSNIADVGNTSAASIPILFDQSVRSQKIKRGDKVLLAAFGAGLTSASILIKY